MATKPVKKPVATAKAAPRKTIAKTAPTPGNVKKELTYPEKVALAEVARKEWLKFTDNKFTKDDVKDFLNKYMSKLGYKPLCKAIRGMEVLVKKPK
jgi:hypothetical protein